MITLYRCTLCGFTSEDKDAVARCESQHHTDFSVKSCSCYRDNYDAPINVNLIDNKTGREYKYILALAPEKF